MLRRTLIAIVIMAWQKSHLPCKHICQSLITSSRIKSDKSRLDKTCTSRKKLSCTFCQRRPEDLHDLNTESRNPARSSKTLWRPGGSRHTKRPLLDDVLTPFARVIYTGHKNSSIPASKCNWWPLNNRHLASVNKEAWLPVVTSIALRLTVRDLVYTDACLYRAIDRTSFVNRQLYVRYVKYFIGHMVLNSCIGTPEL